VQPSRALTDGRYGENPTPLQTLSISSDPQASPANVQDLYLRSLGAIALISAPTISASRKTTGNRPRSCLGIGWQVLLDGSKSPSSPTSSKAAALILTPSPSKSPTASNASRLPSGCRERLPDSLDHDKSYGDIRLAEEQQLSEYSFDRSRPKALRAEFELHEKEARNSSTPGRSARKHVGGSVAALKRYPILAAYDHCLKCSHLFTDGCAR